MKKQIGVIWDQTGVLYKYGRNNVTKAFKEVLRKHSVSFSEEIFSEKYKGTSLANQMRMWEEDFGLKVPLTPEQFSIEAALIEYKLIDKDKEYDENLISFLESLKKQGFPMVVASSSTRERAHKILDILDLRKYFDHVITADEVKNHEPATDTIDLAAKKMGLSPKECIVIEDAASGIIAAKKAGCKTIGYAIYSDEQYNSLKEAGADKVVKDFGDIDISTL